MKFIIICILINYFKIFERNSGTVKTFGIAVRYPSRSNHHNAYKEYRDVSVNGAVS